MPEDPRPARLSGLFYGGAAQLDERVEPAVTASTMRITITYCVV